jgi:hypothetical protein
MKYHKIVLMLLITIVCIPVDQMSGQTRFARPDTTPNYRGYKYIDECMAAVHRLKELALAEDPVWGDTVSLDTFKLRRPLPPQTVNTARLCLEQVDVDTVKFKDIHKVAEALLIADRDADVHRMYRRFADSIANDSSNENFILMMNVYMNAVPVRLDKVIESYNIGLLKLHPDSVVKNLLMRTVVASVSARSGDNQLADKIAKEILTITDTLSSKYRNSPIYYGVARELIFPIFTVLTPPEAVDSLAVSTDAYRRYLEGVWKSIFGSSPGEELDPIARIAPEPTGHFWYSNIDHDGKITSISSKPVIEKGKVTILHFLQGGCHSRYKSVMMGRSNGRGRGSCWGEIHKTKRFLQQYPDINLVVVTSTFGSFGDAPPMEPKEEADTLANYFLGFHGLKGTHIVYQTDFIRLSYPDNRKIDSETENHDRFRYNGRPIIGDNTVIFVDEEGKIFHAGVHTGHWEWSATLRMKTVMERIARKKAAGQL